MREEKQQIDLSLFSEAQKFYCCCCKKNFSFFFLNVGFMRPLWYRSSLSHFLPKIKGRGPHLLLKDRIWAEILWRRWSSKSSFRCTYFFPVSSFEKLQSYTRFLLQKYPILDSFFYLFLSTWKKSFLRKILGLFWFFKELLD